MTDGKMIDLDMARGLLARAVLTQSPDFVYNPHGMGAACFYVPVSPADWSTLNGQPDSQADPETDPRCFTGCLVGVALAFAGITFPKTEVRPIHLIASGGGLPVTADAVTYLRRAQQSQDAGSTWGQAYQDAEVIAQRIITG